MKVLRKLILLVAVMMVMPLAVSCSGQKKAVLSTLPWEEQLKYLYEWGIEFPEPDEGEEDEYPNSWERRAVLTITDAENSLDTDRMPIAISEVNTAKLMEAVDNAVRDYYRDADGNFPSPIDDLMTDKPRLSSLSWDDQVKCLRDLGLEFPDVTDEETGLYISEYYTLEDIWRGAIITRIPFAEMALDLRLAYGSQSRLLENEEYDRRNIITYDFTNAVDEAVRKYYSDPTPADYSRVDALSQSSLADAKYNEFIPSDCGSYAFVVDYWTNGMPYPGCTDRRIWVDDRTIGEIANDVKNDLFYIGYNCIKISNELPEAEGRNIICVRKGTYEDGRAGCYFMKLFEEGWIHKPEEDAPVLKYEGELDPSVPWVSEFYDDVRDMCYQNPNHVYDGQIMYIAYQEDHAPGSGTVCSICGGLNLN